MCGIVDARAHKTKKQVNCDKEGTALQYLPACAGVNQVFAQPHQYQKKSVDCKNSTRRTDADAGVCTHRIKSDAGDAAQKPANQIYRQVFFSAAQDFNHAADRIKRIHVDREVHHAAVQEHRSEQAPQLAVADCQRCKICTPGDEIAAAGLHEVATLERHKNIHADIQGDQNEGQGRIFPGRHWNLLPGFPPAP